MSENLKEYAESEGYWSADQGEFSFKDVYGTSGRDTCRLTAGRNLLEQLSKSGIVDNANVIFK